MKPGQVFSEGLAKDGKRVIIRAPHRDDLDDLLKLINDGVEEDAPILVNRRFTREEEADWLMTKVVSLESGETIFLVGEVEGHAIASCEITRHTFRESHVGTLGVIVSKEWRSLGIGTLLMRSCIDIAKKIGLRLILLQVFATNSEVIRLYERIGFTRVGIVPKMISHRDSYVDSVLMMKEIA